MDWVTFVGASSVFGLGFLAGRLFQRSQPEKTDLLALQLVEEMAQFKAGFLARASHELRSPLNGLIGAHQLILSDLCDDPAEEREYVAQAHESALKLLQMLDELISISKLEAGSSTLALQPVSLNTILENLYQATHMLATNRTVKLNITYPDDQVYVMADPRALQQVLLNLVSSAIATMQTGYLAIAVNATDDTAEIVLEDNRPAGFWQESIDLLSRESEARSYTPMFQFTLAETVLERMQGQLILTAPALDETITRIQCVLPAVREDVA